ncbi:Asp23/Gls24 family envelope stress response protein [Amycolatopsis acidicola]|uniref:Asp23/Gls24 family envelope stress response protein n=1 Tax=Amycolatopsis acidicola TaxID=2596893 RepID=A0A5N0VND3_9PSEU|nr:Asp23/Gls24 family envelope stress response protein [Amycolatopsis acidicola]KAA9166302.1 Asp23/Gls24 family envelope stress response protein [Amycolatopsis acidicola]
MSAQWIIEEPVVAAVAADAALATPGVVRLETGVGGLVRSWGRGKWQQVKGITPAPATGALAEFGDGDLRVRVGIATSGAVPAAAVARQVQREVRAAVTKQTGLDVAEVSVVVLDIEPAEVP